MPTVIIALIIIAVVLGIYIIKTHNTIIAIYNACQRAWADVIAQELQKNRLLPTLEKMVAEYKLHESSLLTHITELRSSLKSLQRNAPNIDQLQAVNQDSKALLSSLNMVAENYPDLKASEIYQSFMRELSELEGNINASIRIYNGNVEKFNTMIEVFPNVYVNNFLTHKQRLDPFNDLTAESAFEYKPNF